jgi:hypothetical protein
MEDVAKVYESELYSIWSRQDFTAKLKTITGDKIEILDSGSLDEESAGPDFKQARIRIGNFTFVGDIEIDKDYSDWKKHGHNIDNKYNSVVLHASLFNKNLQPYVYTKDGRKVPTIVLTDFLHESILKKIKSSQKEIAEDNDSKLRCSHLNRDINFSIKNDLILHFGVDRFKKKCERVYERLKELAFLKQNKINEPVIRYELTPEFKDRIFTPDDFKDKILWQQLFHEMVFEALGYSKNKSIMQKLAQSVDVELITRLGHDSNFIVRIESLFFHVAGLMPEIKFNADTSDYVKKLAEEWEILQRVYDGEKYDETQWHFFKLRPQNFPTVRIAGGARFVESLLYGGLIENIIKKIDEIRNPKVLINSLRSLFVIPSDGYWQKHFVFEEKSESEVKYFVGASRADEILVNVILPFFSVYFDVFGKTELSKKILKLYNIYQQKSDNKIVRDVAEGLGMSEYIKHTVYSQGMIELFRSYCSKNKCLECEIGKIVFN